MNNGIYCSETIGTINLEELDYEYVDLKFFGYNNLTNKLNIFTAADISQYTYMLTLHSDCPVNSLYIEYDIPIEVANNNFDHCFVGTRGILLDSVYLKSMRENPTHVFHVKFPYYANLQLIRSLVLTTLLTALFSLFCRNLYFSIRKWAYKKKKQNRIPVSVARNLSKSTKSKIKYRARKYKNILFAMLLCLLALITAVVIIVIRNSSILLPFELFEYEYCILLVVILLFVVGIIIYFAYRNVRKPLLSAHEGDEDDERQKPDDSFTSIFIHERDEEEELDRLVKEQLKESREKQSEKDSQEGEES